MEIKLRSNRHRPTIDDLKGHFSEVLALVTNNEADHNDDDEDDIPAAAGESAEVEGEHHHGAIDFGPPGGAGPVHPHPVAEEPPEDVGLDPRRHGGAEANEEEVDEEGLESEAVGRVAVRPGTMQPWRAAGRHAMLRPTVGQFREFVTPVRPVQEVRAAWLRKHAYIGLNAFKQCDPGPDDVHAEA